MPALPQHVSESAISTSSTPGIACSSVLGCAPRRGPPHLALAAVRGRGAAAGLTAGPDALGAVARHYARRGGVGAGKELVHDASCYQPPPGAPRANRRYGLGQAAREHRPA